MRELNTIQKRRRLNKVYAVDEKGNGGANHRYQIISKKDEKNPEQRVDVTIQFQNGARNEWGSMLGVIDTDLLENGVQIPGAVSVGSVTTAGNSVTLPITTTIRQGCCCDGASSLTCILVDGASTIRNISVRVEKA